MRNASLAIILGGAMIAALGLAAPAQARCVACPEGFTFWHSRETCVADDKSGRTAEPVAEKKPAKPASAGDARG